MKLRQILNFSTIDITQQKMPFQVVYKFSKLFKWVKEESLFYQEQFQSIIMEYSQKDANGNPVLSADGQGIIIQQDKITTATSRLLELDNLEIETPNIVFTVNELDNLTLTVNDMEFLEFFIQEE